MTNIYNDKKLVKRLLSYAKPYWFSFLLALVLLVFITGLELLNPFLAKLAIDDYLVLDNLIIYEVNTSPISQVDHNYLIIDNQIYIFEEDLQIYKTSEVSPHKIKKTGDNFYLFPQEDDLDKNMKLIDDLSLEKIREYQFSNIKYISFLFFLVILFTFIFTFIQTYILNISGQKIIYNIRNEVFNHIQHMSLSFFDNSTIGSLVTRVNNDIESLNELFTSVLVSLFKDVFTLIGIIIVMLKMDLKLALYSFSFIPIFIFISIKFRNQIRLAYTEYRKQLSKVNTSLNENITGIKTIQIFNKEKDLAQEFDNINSKYLDIAQREIKIHALLRPAIEIIQSLAISILIYSGGNKVLDGTLNFGVLYVFINYLQKFFRPIFELTEKYNILQSSITSGERIFQILDNDDKILDPIRGQNLDDFKGRIEFKNVWFSYDEENWVIKDLNLTIEPGQHIALVGPTGAGKTSIINLLARFYDVQKGEILIDGVNIKDIDKKNLRDLVGVVLQDVFIFSGNILDNIRLNSDISEDKLIETSKYVNAHNFISQLPNGYYEPVMERGATLSTGEKQLLSFARTLAHDPKILVLDEATSNIDTQTEFLIQDALSKLVEDRTTISIAHRLSTIQNADNIIVLDNGIIVEEGTHSELLKKKGKYYNLYTIQFKN